MTKTDKPMLTGTVSKDNEVTCSCGGDVAVEGTMTQQLPLGFGFSAGKFQVDAMRVSGFYGWCMECNAKVFAPKGKRRKVTSVARSNSTKDIRKTFKKLRLTK